MQPNLASAVLSAGHGESDTPQQLQRRRPARAAVANGADAIYFGMPRFNARLRADNFTVEDLPELMKFLHEHGVKGYVAFNTLIFTGELRDAEKQLHLLEDCGVDWKKAKYILAEGADGSSMTRTIPIELVQSDEVLVAYGQNGEMLRPENGYPLRLVVPGVQGVSWVKWLRRIEVGDKPWATKDEAIHYIDLMPDGQHRQYTSVQECKSVITTPSGGQILLDKGFYNISGLAWSGRGKIKRVDVSTDGGINWRPARIEGPVNSKCLTRFNIDWVWDGKPALIQSRAMDETGYVQPTYRQLRAVRGTRSIYHNNAIQSWLVQENGEVKNVQLS